MDTETGGFKPPYMSFQTFWHFLDELSKRPLPPRIDRSLMASKSGTDQNNLTGALTSFGLIDESNTVTARLRAVASADDAERKSLLANMIREFYGPQVALSEAHDTQTALNDSFRDTFALQSPETRRKCVTFFLHALREAELPVSAHFAATRSGSGAPGAPKAKKTVRRRTPAAAPIVEDPVASASASVHDAPFEAPAGANARTVVLKTVGTMTLSVSVDPLRLRGRDRDFFFQVVDLLNDYEEEVAASAPGIGAADHSDSEAAS